MKTMLLSSLLDGALEAVVIVFMLFLCALCLFAVVVIVRDIIHENASIRREGVNYVRQPSVEAETKTSVAQKEAPQEVIPAKAPIAEPVAEAVEAEAETAVTVAKEEEAEAEAETAVTVAKEEEAEAVEAEPIALSEEATADTPADEETAEKVEEPQKGIVFSKRFSMAEKYETLSSEYKAYFDDVARYALSKPGVKEHKYNGSYDYKDGGYKIIRLMIRRGEIICEFSFIDHDLRNYVNSSDVRIKQSATTIKLDEPSAVGATKDGIDLICSQIVKDREYKRDLANAKRRARRQERKQSEGVSEENANK